MTPSRRTRCLSRAGASLRMTRSTSALDTSRPRRPASRRMERPRSARAALSSRRMPMSKSLSCRWRWCARLPKSKARRTSGSWRSARPSRSTTGAASTDLTRAPYLTPSGDATLAGKHVLRHLAVDRADQDEPGRPFEHLDKRDVRGGRKSEKTFQSSVSTEARVSKTRWMSESRRNASHETPTVSATAVNLSRRTPDRDTPRGNTRPSGYPGHRGC